MEQRERDKKSRQILSQQYLCQDTVEEQQPLFNAPIRVAQSDDRIQRQLGPFETAMPLLDKYIGVQGPSQMRSSSNSMPPASYPHSGGYGSSNREGYSSSSSSSRSHMSGAVSSSQQAQSGSQSSSSAFLKPKDAPPPNGMSRYGSSQQQQQHSGHNRQMMHEVSLILMSRLSLSNHLSPGLDVFCFHVPTH